MNMKYITPQNKMNPALLSEGSPYKDQLLVAMPGLRGETFARSVVYICAHSPAGAMGLVVNQRLPEVKFKDLLAQLNLPHSELKMDPIVHFGGPVESGRGFVLHSIDFKREETMFINSHIGITGTVDILRAISEGQGPSKSIFALGYAGWGPGQLDAEMQANAWLTVPADDELIFGPDLSNKWEKALMKMGITPFALSSEVGHA